MKSTIFVLLIALAIGVIRLMPGFPAHGVSLEGSYEAFVHVWMGVCLAGPAVFWFAKYWLVPSVEDRIASDYLFGDDASNHIDAAVARGLRDYAVEFRRSFDRFNKTAHAAFWSALWLTFLVEATKFFIDVPYPWTK